MLTQDKMRPAILLPAVFVMFGADPSFFAITDGLDTVRSYSLRSEEFLGCIGAAVS